MKIRCHAIGVLSPPSGEKRMVLDVPEGSTIKDVLEKCNFNRPTFRNFIFVVNGVRKKLHDELTAMDTLEIYLPIGGG